MIKKSLSSGCPQEVYNLYSVDYFFFFFTTLYVICITVGR